MRGHLKGCLIAGRFTPFPRKVVLQLHGIVDDHLEDDGIEALVVDPPIQESDEDELIINSNGDENDDSFGPCTFTKAYLDEHPGDCPPQKPTFKERPSEVIGEDISSPFDLNPKIKEFEHLKQ